ncbi:MAG TPA: hypothetical protein VIM71_07945 [Lacunisphaera sp.]
MPQVPHEAHGEAAPENSFILKPNSVCRILGTIALLLIFADLAGQLFCHYTGDYRPRTIIKLFNLDRESNVPSSFSAFLLLAASALLAVITVLEKRRQSPGIFHWTLLAAGFLGMAFDELCSLHEKLVAPLQALLGGRYLGIFYFAWVLPGGLLVLGLGLLFIRFLWVLPPKTRVAFIAAGVTYVGGAIGMESVGGLHVESHGRNNLSYAFLVVLEEGLEMAGAILFLRALLNYLSDNFGEVRLRFSRR